LLMHAFSSLTQSKIQKNHSSSIYWCKSNLHTAFKWYRNKAGAIADLLLATDSKTAESFLTGARQALSAAFNSTSRAAKVLSRSTFRFGDMKEGDRPTTVALVIDASRIATQSKVAALIQWRAFTEFKRHSNTSKPVYIIADETSNFKIEGLPSLQTWGREYGIKWHGFIQSISAYRTTYGREALHVLLSETEIKQFLPGQREPEILDLIEKLLGQTATM
jgi:type IV secretion system protein VirD4